MAARLTILRKRLGLDPANRRVPPRPFTAAIITGPFGPHPGSSKPYDETFELAHRGEVGQNVVKASRGDAAGHDLSGEA